DTERLRNGFVASAKRTGGSEQQTAAEWEASVPAHRFGDPSEFGRMCAYLCSVHAGYITGQSILVDGGLYPSTL
ncbi:MAG: SDR family oxidoreductase, partial [Thermoleophilia bacterium]|nr:SDR family oxidoreductase [Thermoleophilia bacterium]